MEIQIQSYAVIEIRCPINVVLGGKPFYKIPTLNSLIKCNEQIPSFHFKDSLPYSTHVNGIFKMSSHIDDCSKVVELLPTIIEFCSNSDEIYSEWVILTGMM